VAILPSLGPVGRAVGVLPRSGTTPGALVTGDVFLLPVRRFSFPGLSIPCFSSINFHRGGVLHPVSAVRLAVPRDTTLLFVVTLFLFFPICLLIRLTVAHRVFFPLPIFCAHSWGAWKRPVFASHEILIRLAYTARCCLRLSFPALFLSHVCFPAVPFVARAFSLFLSQFLPLLISAFYFPLSPTCLLSYRLNISSAGNDFLFFTPSHIPSESVISLPLTMR